MKKATFEPNYKVKTIHINRWFGRPDKIKIKAFSSEEKADRYANRFIRKKKKNKRNKYILAIYQGGYEVLHL